MKYGSLLKNCGKLWVLLILNLNFKHTLRRPRQLPARLQDGVFETSVGNRQQLQVASASSSSSSSASASEYYCSLFPVLDKFLAEMNQRFSSDGSTTIMIAVQACIPDSDTFLDLEAIKYFCQFYDIDNAIQSEIEVARKYLSTQTFKGCAIALLDALPGKFFLYLTQMLRIMVTSFLH